MAASNLDRVSCSLHMTFKYVNLKILSLRVTIVLCVDLKNITLAVEEACSKIFNSLQNVIQIMVASMHPSFLWLSSIPLYMHLIHSSVYGHLGCSHVLATVNSAAMNIRVRVSFSNYSFV